MKDLNWKNLVNTRPCDVEPHNGFAIKVVAWVHLSGKWGAYKGPSDWSGQMVAEQGDLIPKQAACLLFYVLSVSGLPYVS